MQMYNRLPRCSFAQRYIGSTGERIGPPHIVIKVRIPNDGTLLDMLGEWVPHAVDRRELRVGNPVPLYGF